MRLRAEITQKTGPERTTSQMAATKICNKNLAFSRGTNSASVNKGIYRFVKSQKGIIRR